LEGIGPLTVEKELWEKKGVGWNTKISAEKILFRIRGQNLESR